MKNQKVISSKIKIFWIGPLIPTKLITNWAAASPAAIKWQNYLISSLQKAKVDIEWLYYRPDRYWPYGRLIPSQDKIVSNFSFKNKQIKFVNFPFLKDLTTKIYLKNILLNKFKLNKSKTLILISYNASKWINDIFSDNKLRSKFISIYLIADNKAPSGADGYIFLSYYLYRKYNFKNKLHFDGAIYLKKKKNKIKNLRKKKVISFLYSGSFHKWGGASLLLDAIKCINSNNFEICLCGQGNDEEYKLAAKFDHRIKCYGLVTTQKLHQLYQNADVFLNPRPVHMPGNESNFPSKLFDYLAWNKPIISTWSKSFSKEYRKILHISEDNPESFAKAMTKYISPKKFSFKMNKNYVENKTWTKGSKKIISFLKKTILSKNLNKF
jgi:hypothetical protein